METSLLGRNWKWSSCQCSRDTDCDEPNSQIIEKGIEFQSEIEQYSAHWLRTAVVWIKGAEFVACRSAYLKLWRKSNMEWVNQY